MSAIKELKPCHNKKCDRHYEEANTLFCCNNCAKADEWMLNLADVLISEDPRVENVREFENELPHKHSPECLAPAS